MNLDCELNNTPFMGLKLPLTYVKYLFRYIHASLLVEGSGLFLNV